MKTMTDQERIGLFNDTLNKCGKYLLLEDNETIEYNIYEDFDIGVHSFMHIDNLQKFYEKGLISLSQFNKSIQLRDMVINLQSTGEWEFKHFRISEKWMEIMELSDEIKNNI